MALPDSPFPDIKESEQVEQDNRYDSEPTEPTEPTKEPAAAHDQQTSSSMQAFELESEEKVLDTFAVLKTET